MVQARSDLAPVENLVVRAHLENGLIELRDLAGSYHGAMVTATGRAPLALVMGAHLLLLLLTAKRHFARRRWALPPLC